MNDHHRHVITSAPREVQEYLCGYFELDEDPDRLVPGLLWRRLGQADVVLALLQEGGDPALLTAERLVGRTIRRGPTSAMFGPPAPVRAGPVEDRVRRVAPENPCLPTTGAYARFASVRVGMTVTRLLERGVTRRDIRRWTRAGHLEIGR